MNSPERLRTPLIRRHGKLEPVTWDEAIALVASGCARSPRTARTAVGGIGSTHTTNEEAYLFQKLLRAGLSTNNVDHRHGVFPAPASGRCQRRGLRGSGPARSPSSTTRRTSCCWAPILPRQPILDLRIRKAIRRGARVHILSADANRLDRLAASATRYRAGETSAVARALLALVREMAGLTAESAEGAEGRGGATSNPAASPLSSQEEDWGGLGAGSHWGLGGGPLRIRRPCRAGGDRPGGAARGGAGARGLEGRDHPL